MKIYCVEKERMLWYFISVKKFLRIVFKEIFLAQNPFLNSFCGKTVYIIFEKLNVKKNYSLKILAAFNVVFPH